MSSPCTLSYTTDEIAADAARLGLTPDDLDDLTTYARTTAGVSSEDDVTAVVAHELAHLAMARINGTNHFTPDNPLHALA